MNRALITVAASIGLALVASPAMATPDDTITVYWQMPTPEGGWSADPTAETATWPQTYLPSLDALECGTWAQGDVYRFQSKKDRAAVEALWADGLLSMTDDGPEDAGLHADVDPQWWFVYGGDCPPPKPNPVITTDTDRAFDCIAHEWQVVTYYFKSDWVLVDNEWVASEPILVETVLSTEPGSDGDREMCPPELAQTGLTPAASWLVLLAGGCVAFGAAATWSAWVSRDRMKREGL